VAARIDHQEIGDTPKAVTYFSVRQQPWFGWRSIVVRSAQPVDRVAETIRQVVAEADPNVPLYDVQTLEGRIERYLGPRRLALLAFGTFAGLSLLLAAIGAYGVMRYATGQRRREIGIRLAVGAEPGHVLALVMRQGLTVIAVGVALGVAASLMLTRLMRDILYGITPHDPVAFAGAAAALAAVGWLASWLPARRAARLDPVEVLRHD
jgi:putative ABC transport system permease protein